MASGEIVGVKLKIKLMRSHSLDSLDGGIGSVAAAATMLFVIWLGAAIIVLGPVSTLQQALKSSRVIAALDSHLPPVTTVLGSLNKLIDPNGFPQVFRGLEPSPANTALPNLGSFNSVVANARASVVKVAGTGCGGIVEGSGFVYSKGRVATNAHVVAGVRAPKVLDANGTHDTKLVFLDTNTDLAVLQVEGLAGKPLALNLANQPNGTPAVVLGYPGGGQFDAQAAALVERFSALGRNIYGQGSTVRDVYSLKAKVIPGNSGGPVLDANGQVIGVVFATSTTYNDIGYALTSHQVVNDLNIGASADSAVKTGSCSE